MEVWSMKMYYGTSSTGNVSEALKGVSNPKLFLLTAFDDCFEKCVEDLERLYPGVPSIGIVGRGYGKSVVGKRKNCAAHNSAVGIFVLILYFKRTLCVMLAHFVDYDSGSVGGVSVFAKKLAGFF